MSFLFPHRKVKCTNEHNGRNVFTPNHQLLLLLDSLSKLPATGNRSTISNGFFSHLNLVTKGWAVGIGTHHVCAQDPSHGLALNWFKLKKNNVFIWFYFMIFIFEKQKLTTNNSPANVRWVLRVED